MGSGHLLTHFFRALLPVEAAWRTQLLNLPVSNIPLHFPITY
jgi:hypothetical protein